MSYQVLARKWRPQTFADVVDQEHVLTALANSLSLGRIHHAYLFSDARGVGKTSIARLLAKGLNCETGITATPCGVYDNCRKIEQRRFADLIEIDAASRTKVEDIRDLLDNVQYAPARGRFKAYLIDEVRILSRHSFNALLKTLEESPAHVKFLLATTDLQKLPVTILSCCLQFHLKTLDVERIRHQLEHILKEEHIAHEPRTLQLLACAANGSLRDTLSLTGQAIVSDDGQVSTEAVSIMLDTLDDDQALSLVEAVVAVDGERVMTLVNDIATCGIEWEALLVEMSVLLHRTAMVQLSPAALGSDMAAIEQRMRELTRVVPPTDVQLYHRTLLIGRKELPYVPDKRMSVEIALLRTLALHPRMPFPEPKIPRQSFAPVTLTAVTIPTQVQQQPAPVQQQQNVPLSGATSQVLTVRSQLQRAQGAAKAKKSEPTAASHARPVNNAALERLAPMSERVQACPAVSALEKAPAKKEAYHWKATNPIAEAKEVVATPKALKKALEHEKTPELAAKLAAEAIERDPWVAQASQLSLPKLVEQVALDAWKEENGNVVCLHLRSTQRHLNSSGAQQKLVEALSFLTGSAVELTIVENDNPAVRTPLEWRQAIHEEKLAQACESIIADNSIQTLRRFFDVELDERGIRPI